MTLSLNNAWFVDRGVGKGVLNIATNSTPSSALAGKFYFEVQFLLLGGLSTLLVGVASSSFQLNDSIDVAVAGTEPLQAECAVMSGSAPSCNCLGWGYPARFPAGTPNITFATLGDWIGVAVDTVIGRLWMRNATAASSTWTGDGALTPNPVTGVHGFDISSQITGNIYITAGTNKNWFDGDTTHSTVVLNSGATAFAATAPTGFTAWDTTSATTFNPSDKDSRITLSGGNLTADTDMPSPFSTPPFSHNAMVRSTTHKTRV